MVDKTFASGIGRRTENGCGNVPPTPASSIADEVQRLRNRVPGAPGTAGLDDEVQRLKKRIPAPPPGVTGGRGVVTPPFVKANNLYKHDTDNVVTSSKEPKDAEERIPLNLNFIPNLLDAYDNVTYHWKFFIATPEANANGKVFSPRSQTIIAETGVTELTIDKVEITSIATPTAQSGTGTSIEVKFEILEPAGAGLIDKIFYQSIAMGIGNWNTMPFYLQLQFKGRTPDTSEAQDGMPGDLGTLRWLWALKLHNIEANVTTMGTRYNFSAIIYNQLAQSNASSSLQHPTVLNKLSTFEDAMMKLQDKLNEDQIYKLIDNNGIPDSYRIIVDPEIAGYNITPASTSTNSQRSSNTGTFVGKDATFPAGTSIDKIIDSLLAQTKEYQTSLIGSNAAGEEGQLSTQEKTQMKSFWRITTETRPVAYDVRRTDFAKEFIIYVFKYDLGIMDSNVFQDSAPPLTLAAERKRLATYAKKRILKKKYNYIYTGLNDQVINFDIRINNAFASAQARMGGIYTNSAMHDMGVVAQEHAEEEARVTSKLRQWLSLMNTSDSASAEANNAGIMDNSASVDAARREYQESIANSRLSAARKAEFERIAENAKPESRLNFVRSFQQKSVQSAQFIARDLATPRDQKISESDRRFISDVNQFGTEAQQAYKDYVKLLKGKLRPIARIDSMHQRQIGQGIEPNSDSGLAKLSSMFAVALHSNLDGSYATTKMTIKGDPFWLFPQPYTSPENETIYNSLKDPQTAIDILRRGHIKVNYAANIYGTDNFVIIRFRTPKVYNTDDKIDDSEPITDVEAFSGLFRVTHITSRFEGGKFQQELFCQLDPFINILNFGPEIEAANGERDVIPTVSDLTQNIVPPDIGKSSRVNGTDIVPGVEKSIQGAANVGTKLSSNIPTINPSTLRRS